MHSDLAKSIRLFEQGLAACTHADDRPVIRDYMAALAPLLARAVLGEDILSRLATIEHLFGNRWRPLTTGRFGADKGVLLADPCGGWI